jgi:hypothetical protein
MRRVYGWACNDLRDAAKKLVRSGGAEKYAEAVRDAKFAKAQAASFLNTHIRENHDEGVSA